MGEPVRPTPAAEVADMDDDELMALAQSQPDAVPHGQMPLWHQHRFR